MGSQPTVHRQHIILLIYVLVATLRRHRSIEQISLTRMCRKQIQPAYHDDNDGSRTSDLFVVFLEIPHWEK